MENASSLTSCRNVLNIYRMTTHNGPGIRTLIQFKGCPLHCLWCSTPESQRTEPELALYPAKCIQCGSCISACPLNAIEAESESIRIDRAVCDNCGKCSEVCCPEALKLLGRAMTVEEIMEEVRRDAVFYRHSGGGVTLSGGEPLLNPVFTGELLRALKQEGISAGADTCGHVSWEGLAPLLPYMDFFLWDLKHMNPVIHQELTGVSNELILSNARKVSERNIPLYIRIPVIPGCNDSVENIMAACAFALSLPSLVEIYLMPVHHLGKARYESLNRAYPIADDLHVPDRSLQELKQMIQSAGIRCSIAV